MFSSLVLNNYVCSVLSSCCLLSHGISWILLWFLITYLWGNFFLFRISQNLLWHTCLLFYITVFFICTWDWYNSSFVMTANNIHESIFNSGSSSCPNPLTLQSSNTVYLGWIVSSWNNYVSSCSGCKMHLLYLLMVCSSPYIILAS